MGTPIDLQDTIVQISALGVTYATIANVTGYSATHGQDGETRVRVFGLANAYIRAGDLTDSYDLSGLYDIADTDGQNVLRAARDAGTSVFVKVLPDGGDGYLQECNVMEYTDSGEADGEYVECSFSLEAIGTKSTATLI